MLPRGLGLDLPGGTSGATPSSAGNGMATMHRLRRDEARRRLDIIALRQARSRDRQLARASPPGPRRPLRRPGTNVGAGPVRGVVAPPGGARTTLIPPRSLWRVGLTGLGSRSSKKHRPAPAARLRATRGVVRDAGIFPSPRRRHEIRSSHPGDLFAVRGVRLDRASRSRRRAEAVQGADGEQPAQGDRIGSDGNTWFDRGH